MRFLPTQLGKLSRERIFFYCPVFHSEIMHQGKNCLAMRFARRVHYNRNFSVKFPVRLVINFLIALLDEKSD